MIRFFVGPAIEAQVGGWPQQFLQPGAFVVAVARKDRQPDSGRQPADPLADSWTIVVGTVEDAGQATVDPDIDPRGIIRDMASRFSPTRHEGPCPDPNGQTAGAAFDAVAGNFAVCVNLRHPCRLEVPGEGAA